MNAKLVSSYGLYSKKRAKLLKSRRWQQHDWDAENRAYQRFMSEFEASGEMTEDDEAYMSAWGRLLVKYNPSAE